MEQTMSYRVRMTFAYQGEPVATHVDYLVDSEAEAVEHLDNYETGFLRAQQAEIIDWTPTYREYAQLDGRIVKFQADADA
jgi:hypothetical protein